MKFHISSERGFTEIPLGTPRSKIRDLFDTLPISKKAAPWDFAVSDYYDNHDLRFSFDKNECLESIGFTSSSNVFLEDVSLKKLKSNNVFSEFKKKSYTFFKDEESNFYNDELGLSLLLDGKNIEAYELYLGKYIDCKNRISSQAELFIRTKYPNRI